MAMRRKPNVGQIMKKNTDSKYLTKPTPVVQGLHDKKVRFVRLVRDITISGVGTFFVSGVGRDGKARVEIHTRSVSDGDRVGSKITFWHHPFPGHSISKITAVTDESLAYDYTVEFRTE